jgi:DNA-binding winged helix-turn-helix (wHTH) protein
MSVEWPSARGSVLTASGPGGRTTADGCIKLTLPDDDWNRLHAGRQMPNPPAEGNEVVMRAYKTNRDSFDRTNSASVAVETRISGSRPLRMLNTSGRAGQQRCFARSAQALPMPQNEATELLSLKGLPDPVRHLVEDVLAELRSDMLSPNVDIRRLLPTTLEKIAGRIRDSSLRRWTGSERRLGTIDVRSREAAPAAAGAETTLRVGALELDLIDRTARRDGRQIDLRPREFLLLKYMMQRSEEVLTRATLLKEVWHYKFIPETNLVDVHLGRLRRKVDAANEAPMIRNIRGVGFVLSASPLALASPTEWAERSASCS